MLNAGNSGTLARLILPLLIKSPKKIKIIGDKSLSKRDMRRVIVPRYEEVKTLETESLATIFAYSWKSIPITNVIDIRLRFQVLKKHTLYWQLLIL